MAKIRETIIFPSTLTFIAFQLVSAIDRGIKLSLKELDHELDYKNDIFEFLNKKFPKEFNFSIVTQIAKEFLVDIYHDIHFAHGPKEFDIGNDGLCVLLAYTIEIIQRERGLLRDKGFGFQLEIDPNYYGGRDDDLV